MCFHSFSIYYFIVDFSASKLHMIFFFFLFKLIKYIMLTHKQMEAYFSLKLFVFEKPIIFTCYSFNEMGRVNHISCRVSNS